MSEEQGKPKNVVGMIAKAVVVVILLGVIYHFGKKALSGTQGYGDVKKAQGLMTQKKYDEAIPLLEPVANASGRYQENARFELAKCYMHKAVQIGERSQGGNLKKDQYEKCVGFLEKSLSYYSMCKDSKEDQVGILEQLMETHLAADQPEKLRDAAERLLKLDDKNEQAKRYHKMSYMLHELKGKRDAEKGKDKEPK